MAEIDGGMSRCMTKSAAYAISGLSRSDSNQLLSANNVADCGCTLSETPQEGNRILTKSYRGSLSKLSKFYMTFKVNSSLTEPPAAAIRITLGTTSTSGTFFAFNRGLKIEYDPSLEGREFAWSVRPTTYNLKFKKPGSKSNIIIHGAVKEMELVES